MPTLWHLITFAASVILLSHTDTRTHRHTHTQTLSHTEYTQNRKTKYKESLLSLYFLTETHIIVIVYTLHSLLMIHATLLIYLLP